MSLYKKLYNENTSDKFHNEKFDVYFIVDNQKFTVATDIENRGDACWFRRQLALALERLIKSNGGIK